MSDVLPTDCSPRNTSLNFLSGLPKSPEVDMVAVVQRTFAILSLTPQSLLFESLLKHTRLDRRRRLRLAAGRPQRSRRHRTPRRVCFRSDSKSKDCG